MLKGNLRNENADLYFEKTISLKYYAIVITW